MNGEYYKNIKQQIDNIPEYLTIHNYYQHYLLILPILQSIHDEEELKRIDEQYNIILYPILPTIYKISQKYNIEFDDYKFNFVYMTLNYVYNGLEHDLEYPY